MVHSQLSSDLSVESQRTTAVCQGQSPLKRGRRTFLYSAMGELVCSGQLWARAERAKFQSEKHNSGRHSAHVTLHLRDTRRLQAPGQEAASQLQGWIVRAFSSNSLVNTMDMKAAIQYILTATQSSGSQVYYKKSRMTILGLAGELFFENEQA